MTKFKTLGFGNGPRAAGRNGPRAAGRIAPGTSGEGGQRPGKKGKELRGVGVARRKSRSFHDETGTQKGVRPGRRTLLGEEEREKRRIDYY